MTTEQILQHALEYKTILFTESTENKNRLLTKMAEHILSSTSLILKENEKDLEAATGHISDVMLDRLRLSESRIRDMADGILEVVKLQDPVNRILDDYTANNGLHIQKKAVPMGVIAIIYESRPNVTSDAAALCIKSGNACILRSGKEAYRTSKAIVNAMQDACLSCHYPKELIQIVDDTTRESANVLMKAHGIIDLLIPRGGKGLIRSCIENATVPCIETGTGICSIYVDKDANLEKAIRIITNAKTQRPSVCNAAETCLVSMDVAKTFLPMLKKALVDDRKMQNQIPVELRLCDKAAKIIEGTPATSEDYDTEFLDYILAVKVVKNVEEAVAHIAAHSTHHSEAIITENTEAANYFTGNVDSAAVYVNASTRFTDGGCFGLGCEMGISTQKLHARGPMGLCELTSYKYVITGDGQIR